MELYVVLDTKGDGRVLGVFDDHATAETFVSQDPCYYKLYRCRLNEINPDSLSWADSSSQRTAMERIISLVAKRCAR